MLRYKHVLLYLLYIFPAIVDNGDDFQTPMSTPPSEAERVEPMETSDLSNFALSEAQLYDKLYER